MLHNISVSHESHCVVGIFIFVLKHYEQDLVNNDLGNQQLFFSFSFLLFFF